MGDGLLQCPLFDFLCSLKYLLAVLLLLLLLLPCECRVSRVGLRVRNMESRDYDDVAATEGRKEVRNASRESLKGNGKEVVEARIMANYEILWVG